MGYHQDGLLADPPEQVRVFVQDGKITKMPAKRTRRRLLLDQVAQLPAAGSYAGLTRSANLLPARLTII